MAAVNEKVAKEVAKRKRTVRNFPAAPFEEPLAFVKQIFEFGSGEPVRRLRFFDHISKAPDSGASRMLVTNANKYGLTKGSYVVALACRFSSMTKALPDVTDASFYTDSIQTISRDPNT
jgi:hypothetical protein